MARIPQDIIDRIREASDILDVVSDYVELRRRGRNFFGLCPFHPEKTPSFSIAPDKQIFHCFGCGIGGNVITFLMEYEKIEFVEAIQKLGQKYGIKVEFQKDDKSKEFFTHLYEIHEIAVRHFQKNLNSPTGEKVLKYLEDRGLTSETVRKFSLGFADNSWDSLLSLIKSKKFPDEVIEKSGLFTKSEKGVFDRFRGRIMFPITNLANRIVAFGGRDFTGESDAKYINSSETPIYNKSEILFGLSKTKEAVRKEKFIIVVEGYMDFLQLYQNGIQNVAATSGTALTEKHVNHIRKFTNTAYLAYDGDDAGKRAAIRAGYNLLKGGIIPEIIDVPEGLDPDNWVLKDGSDPLLTGVKKSKGLIDFHVANCGLDLSKPANRSRLAGEIMDEVMYVRDEIIRRFTIKQIAEILSVDEDILLRRLAFRSRKFRKSPIVRKEKPAQEESLFSPIERAQFEIVKLLASGDHETARFIKKHLQLKHFSHPALKLLAKNLLNQLERGDTIEISSALDKFSKKSDRDLASRILFEASPHADSKKVAVDCLITLERTPLKQSITEHRIKLRELEKKSEDISSTILKVVELQKQLKALDSKRIELLNLSS